MTDLEKIDRALALMREASSLVSSVKASDNEDLQSYALDGLGGDTRSYLETLRRRLVDPEDN